MMFAVSHPTDCSGAFYVENDALDFARSYSFQEIGKNPVYWVLTHNTASLFISQKIYTKAISFGLSVCKHLYEDSKGIIYPLPNLIIEADLTHYHSRKWHAAILSGPGVQDEDFASLTIDTKEPHLVFRRFFMPIRFWRQLGMLSLFCMPPDGTLMRVHTHRPLNNKLGCKVRIFQIPRGLAALILIILGSRLIYNTDKRLSLRRRLSYSSMRLGQPESYELWCRYYDRWRSASNYSSPSVLAIIFNKSGNAPLVATLAGLANQVDHIEVLNSENVVYLRELLNTAKQDFVLIINAGEVLAPYAVGALCCYAAAKSLSIVYADEDSLDTAGIRSAPWFKPEPSLMLMLSGALVTGAWLVRRTLLAGFSDKAVNFAETLRLDAWLRLDALAAATQTPTASGRLPFILTHRRPDTVAISPANVAALARHHLTEDWTGTIDTTKLPLIIRCGLGNMTPKISIIIATTGRLPHIRRCLDAILTHTNYPNFELILVLSQSGPPDTAQLKNIGPALADQHVSLVLAPMSRFNYASANNFAVRQSTATLICLLNDDIAPLAPDWLNIMVGHLHDQRVATVGAKLYYPDGKIQHGGVIMGLGGLCDHAFRFLPRGKAGYANRAVLDQELSAVTGACMLIRRSVFNAVGGLDESFASAFNDIDLCVKIRAAGHSIVWSAQAELWHYETISFKHHYKGDRINEEQRDIDRLRARWLAQGGLDPFHNPNLSLDTQNEWTPAFPPRLETWQILAGLEPVP